MTRVAIVTGARRGLGEAIARRLHGDGYSVALADIDRVGADRVADELGQGAFAFLATTVRELRAEPMVADAAERIEASGRGNSEGRLGRSD